MTAGIKTSICSYTKYFYENEKAASMKIVEYSIILVSLLLLLVTFPISIFFCIQIVNEYERVIIFRLGRIESGVKGPGLFFIIPCLDKCYKLDLRTTYSDVPPQQALTKDSVSVTVDAILYYRIQDPLKTIMLSNPNYSTGLLAMTVLRDIVGTKNLTDILSDREGTSAAMQKTLDGITLNRWGIKVERVELQEVKIPPQLQLAMAAEAISTREAKSKLITSEGEMTASRALKEAADIMIQSPATLQLRYLQTLTNISAINNQTIIFPLPIDILDRKSVV